MNERSPAKILGDWQKQINAASLPVPKAQPVDCYSPARLPPGAVPIRKGYWYESGLKIRADRITPDLLAKRGVPVIADVSDAGSIQMDPEFSDLECDRLPLRFPWDTWAFALRVRNGIAICSRANPTQIQAGRDVAINYGIFGDWEAIFGTVDVVTPERYFIAKGDGGLADLQIEHVHRAYLVFQSTPA